MKNSKRLNLYLLMLPIIFLMSNFLLAANVSYQKKLIKLPPEAAMMDIIQVGAKLYFTTYPVDTVTPIDAATLELEKPIAVGSKPRSLVAAGTKIYVGNSGDNTISIIDATTDTVIGQIQAGIGKPLGIIDGGVTNLAIVGDKLYAWVRSDKTLFVIDLRSEQVVGELPFPTDAVHTMKAVGDILYVLTAKNIVMVDTKTDKVSAPLLNDEAVVFWKGEHIPNTLVIASDKAYVLSEVGRLFIYDLKTKEEIKDAIQISDVASLGETLVFVGSKREKTISIWNSASKKGNEKVGSIEIPYYDSTIFVTSDTLYVWSFGQDEMVQIKKEN